jgi:ATP-dependent DNA helicase RecQ
MEHGRWWVTDEGWRVLRGKATIELRKDMASGAAKGTRRERRAATPAVVAEPDIVLFEALKALRTRLAQEQKVPAYVVFSDRTLAELAAHRPTSPRAFREIHGVGDAKLERYGAAFLEVVQNHAR